MGFFKYHLKLSFENKKKMPTGGNSYNESPIIAYFRFLISFINDLKMKYSCYIIHRIKVFLLSPICIDYYVTKNWEEVVSEIWKKRGGGAWSKHVKCTLHRLLYVMVIFKYDLGSTERRGECTSKLT